jgi:hypothetical protein
MRSLLLYQQNLIVTGNIWNVVVTLDLKWYRSQLDLIDLILKQVENIQRYPRSLNTSRYVNWQMKIFESCMGTAKFRISGYKKVIATDTIKEGTFVFRWKYINLFIRDIDKR